MEVGITQKGVYNRQLAFFQLVMSNGGKQTGHNLLLLALYCDWAQARLKHDSNSGT